jgi:hypothetical protein
MDSYNRTRATCTGRSGPSDESRRCGDVTRSRIEGVWPVFCIRRRFQFTYLATDQDGNESRSIHLTASTQSPGIWRHKTSPRYNECVRFRELVGSRWW